MHTAVQDLLLPDLYPEFFVGEAKDLPAVCRMRALSYYPNPPNPNAYVVAYALHYYLAYRNAPFH